MEYLSLVNFQVTSFLCIHYRLRLRQRTRQLSTCATSITLSFRLYTFKSDLLRQSNGIIGCRSDHAKGIMKKPKTASTGTSTKTPEEQKERRKKKRKKKEQHERAAGHSNGADYAAS
jgi:CCR4-NOT transcriptional regulation complex NOT5 subunit